MSSWFNERHYLLDDEPISANELIQRAAGINDSFANSFIKQTSVAASILRDAGHVVSQPVLDDLNGDDR